MANRTGELGKGWRPVYWFKLGTGDLISPQGLPTVQHPPGRSGPSRCLLLCPIGTPRP